MPCSACPTSRTNGEPHSRIPRLSHGAGCLDAVERLRPAQRSGKWSHRFNRAGTFDLICTIHGAGDMGMKVVVR
jgi:hypothetical protein